MIKRNVFPSIKYIANKKYPEYANELLKILDYNISIPFDPKYHSYIIANGFGIAYGRNKKNIYNDYKRITQKQMTSYALLEQKLNPIKLYSVLKIGKFNIRDIQPIIVLRTKEEVVEFAEIMMNIININALRITITNCNTQISSLKNLKILYTRVASPLTKPLYASLFHFDSRSLKKLYGINIKVHSSTKYCNNYYRTFNKYHKKIRLINFEDFKYYTENFFLQPRQFSDV